MQVHRIHIPKEAQPLMSFPDVVRELARERGWSLGELARRCGIPEGTVSAWVYQKGSPTLTSLLRLARGTGKPLSEIAAMLGDEELPGKRSTEMKTG